MDKKTTQHTTGSAADANAPTDKQVHFLAKLKEDLDLAIDKILHESNKKECSHLIDVLLLVTNDYVIHSRLPKREEKESTPSSAR